MFGGLDHRREPEAGDEKTAAGKGDGRGVDPGADLQALSRFMTKKQALKGRFLSGGEQQDASPLQGP